MGTRADISLEHIISVNDDIVMKLGGVNGEVVEVKDKLPAVVDPDIILGHVCIWKDILNHLGEGVYLRVYAQVYNPTVEKYVVSLVQNCEHILITPVPIDV